MAAEDIRNLVRKTVEKMRGDSDRVTATVAQIRDAMPGAEKNKPSSGSINYHLKALEQAGIFRIVSQGSRHPLEYIWGEGQPTEAGTSQEAQEAPKPARNGKGKDNGAQTLTDRFQVVKDALSAEQALRERLTTERDAEKDRADRLQRELDEIVSAVTEGLAKAS